MKRAVVWELPGGYDDVLLDGVDNRLHPVDVLRLVPDRLLDADVVLLVHEEVRVFFFFFRTDLSLVFASAFNPLVGSRSKPGLAICE